MVSTGSCGSRHRASPHGVSPVAVYGYHTCLFSLGAPKLSCLTGFSVPEVFESIRCEAYGPGGAALIVDCRTDNRDRTVAQVRQVLLQYGGVLGAQGSVAYLFNEVGRLVFPRGTDFKRAIRVALEAGAEDAETASLEVLTDPIDFETVRKALGAAGFVPTLAKVTQRASMSVPLDGEDATLMAQLIEALQDLSDVENVYTNGEIPDEVLARFRSAPR
jgi:transcriptional/translational regulatory protein YebC/TACO1